MGLANVGIELESKDEELEDVLNPESYVEDLDPRGAFISPISVLGRHLRELKEAFVFKILAKEDKSKK